VDEVVGTHNNVAGETGTPVLGPPMSLDEAQAIIARGR